MGGSSDTLSANINKLQFVIHLPSASVPGGIAHKIISTFSIRDENLLRGGVAYIRFNTVQKISATKERAPISLRVLDLKWKTESELLED